MVISREKKIRIIIEKHSFVYNANAHCLMMCTGIEVHNCTAAVTIITSAFLSTWEKFRMDVLHTCFATLSVLQA